MKCICGCDRDPVWLISGKAVNGSYYNTPVCDEFCEYCRVSAAYMNLFFQKKRITPATEDYPATEPQVSDQGGRLEPSGFLDSLAVAGRCRCALLDLRRRGRGALAV
jgi:hypothetical protein